MLNNVQNVGSKTTESDSNAAAAQAHAIAYAQVRVVTCLCITLFADRQSIGTRFSDYDDSLTFNQ